MSFRHSKETWDRIEKFLQSDECTSSSQAARKFNFLQGVISSHCLQYDWYRKKFIPIPRPPKEIWPEIENFLKLGEQISVRGAAKKFKVSHNAISERFKKENWYQEKFGRKPKAKYALPRQIITRILQGQTYNQIRAEILITREQLDNQVRWLEATFIKGDSNLLSEFSDEDILFFGEWKRLYL